MQGLSLRRPWVPLPNRTLVRPTIMPNVHTLHVWCARPESSSPDILLRLSFSGAGMPVPFLGSNAHPLHEQSTGASYHR